MQEFLYRAIDPEGTPRSGSVRGLSIEAALEILESDGLSEVKLEPREGSLTLAKASAGEALAPRTIAEMEELLASAQPPVQDAVPEAPEAPMFSPIARASFIAFLCGGLAGASCPMFYFGWVPRWEVMALLAGALVAGLVVLGRSQTPEESRARAKAFLVGTIFGGLGACVMRVFFSLCFWLSGLNWTLS